MSQRSRNLLFLLVVAILAGVLFALTVPLFATWRLEDFAVTFYRAAQCFWRGENVYLSDYPHPFNGRQYPPFAPIWILYVFVPFGALPLPIAEALRLLLDVALLPLLAYLSARWARLKNVWLGVLLVLAPWLLTEISAGQLTPLVLVGVLLCYWGGRRASAPMTAIGLWLALSKFTIVSLVIFATVVFAWRRRILSRTLAILGGLIVVASVLSPAWILDLLRLYVERLANPRLVDSVLLLPGYPWSQLVLLAIGALLFSAYVWHARITQPSPWLWAVLSCASLVGALHTFVYDWQLLMLPFALLLQSRSGIALTIVVYVYSLAWAILSIAFSFPLPSPSAIPATVLLSILMWGFANRNVLIHEAGLANESSDH